MIIEILHIYIDISIFRQFNGNKLFNEDEILCNIVILFMSGFEKKLNVSRKHFILCFTLYPCLSDKQREN